MIVASYFTLPQVGYIVNNWNAIQTPSWALQPAGKPGTRTPPAIDIDTMFIHGGLAAAPSFRDTLRWWHGTWAGQVVFYRPISSYAFWIDWKLFGDHEARYTLLSILLHLAAVWQFVRLSLTLFRYFRLPRPGYSSLLSGLFFVDGLYALGIRQQTNSAVFARWKNMPESLVTLFFCLSLNAYVNRTTEQESGGPNPITTRKSRIRTLFQFAAPVVWYLASCASKEAGVLMPLLLIPLELPSLTGNAAQRWAAIRRMAPVLAALPVFLVLRRVFLGMTTGFTYGSNGAWIGRMTDNLLGAAGHDIRTGRYTPLLTGISLAVSICLFVDALRREAGAERDRGLIRAAVASAALPLVVSMFVNTNFSPGIRPFVFIMQAVDTGSGLEVTGIAVMLVGVISVFRFRPVIGLFGYTWVVATLVLLAFTPSSIHREYLVEGGFAIMLAAGLTVWEAASPASPRRESAASSRFY
jgi:hypothetical protein